MLSILLKPLKWAPLNIIHRLGNAVGYAAFACSARNRKLVYSNINQSQLLANKAEIEKLARINAAESGKSLLESLAIWQKPEQELLSWVTHCANWQIVEQAIHQGKGLIFLTPHLGCYEITSIYYGARHPITVLFRPPKKTFLQGYINQGRARTGVTLAEANTSGVRKLMQALKRGEAIGILPDQVPAAGEGEWANFFGKPAYTMTLASKLAEKTGAAVIMAFGERLAQGKGYAIHLTEVNSIATPALLNQAIEQQIAKKPEQYLWQYNRYKVRRHAKPLLKK